MSSKLMKKRLKQELQNDAPEELDGYQLERAEAGDAELPTYLIIELNEPSQS